MSTNPKVMHSMQCDHPDGCSAELETYDGGSWLYDTAEEAREAARDYDWVTDGEHDYCDRHRDDMAKPVGSAREWCVSCPDCHPGKVIAEPCGKVHDCPECAAQRTGTR